MDLKLIVSTFFVIFLAELGDKTQFAAMAASAGSNKPISILIGAVLALAVSSIIAVAAGALIGNLIPIRYIKIAAGVLFIIFGLLYIRESFIIEKPQPETHSVKSGVFLGESISKAAQAFEEEELNMLVTAGEKITEPDCRAVIDELIKEEERHLNTLRDITYEETAYSPEEFAEHQILNETFACSDEDDATLSEICRREEAMADFYRIMAEKTVIASAKAALQHLHLEEKEHADRIRKLLKKA